MREDHRGFSLVELIVVIAVMAVLTVSGLLSFGMVSGQNLKSCASGLESYLGQTRIQALSREKAELILTVETDGVYAEIVMERREADGSVSRTVLQREKIGKSGITVSYRTDMGGSAEYEVSDTLPLVLSFDRSSGAFLPLEGGSSYCTDILLTGGSRTRRLVLVPLTGKYYIDDSAGGT